MPPERGRAASSARACASCPVPARLSARQASATACAAPPLATSSAQSARAPAKFAAHQSHRGALQPRRAVARVAGQQTVSSSALGGVEVVAVLQGLGIQAARAGGCAGSRHGRGQHRLGTTHVHGFTQQPRAVDEGACQRDAGGVARIGAPARDELAQSRIRHRLPHIRHDEGCIRRHEAIGRRRGRWMDQRRGESRQHERSVPGPSSLGLLRVPAPRTRPGRPHPAG